jgi:hypothetical protein
MESFGASSSSELSALAVSFILHFLELGLTFSSLSEFVREAAIPYIKTLSTAGFNSKKLGLTVPVS